MIKRAAVTGHTSGLGKSWYQSLTNHGYTVTGFSRSTGYDLRDYSQVTAMLNEIKHFDLFINNAKPDYAQSQILYRLVREWDQGTIVSIGSSATQHELKWTDLYLLEYLTQKIALCHAHKVLEPLSSCRLILIHPDHLDDTDQLVEHTIKILGL